MHADPRTLGLTRILLAGLLLIDLGWQSGRLTRDVGIAPFSFTGGGSNQYDWAALCLLAALPALAMLLGHRTRMAQGLSLIAFIGLHAPPQGAGVLALGASLWWIALLPAGRRLSIDAIGQGLRHLETSPEAIRAFAERRRDDTPVHSLAVAALRLQLGWLCLAASFDAVGAIVAALVAAASLTGAESMGRSGNWLRLVTMLAVLCLAASVLLLGGEPMLAGVLAALAPSLLVARDWQAVLTWARPRRRRIVYYDGGCGICFQLARIAARMDLFERLDLRASLEARPEDLPDGFAIESLDETLLVIDVERGTHSVRGEAWGDVIHSLPAGFLAAWVFEAPLLRRAGNLFYDQFAPRRARISTFLGYAGCGLQPIAAPGNRSLDLSDLGLPSGELALLRGRLGRGLREVAVATLLLMSAMQLLSDPRTAPTAARIGSMPRWAATLGACTRIDQPGMRVGRSQTIRAPHPR
jgi:predicted DCC family thiol-disulfide oxidoreductase YuxK